MSADFDKLREVFLAALDQAPDQRDVFLDQRCGDDADLRRNVLVMLKAHDAGEGPLDRGAVRDQQTTAFEPAAERPGTFIGPYKLLEPIGEGGMGTVWMAQQTEPVKRLVAVKHIKAGMDSRQVIARFEAERQALALMDHPNIARVLDAGTTCAGRPYFVMDLVKGLPITRYCDEHHLTPRERLELFLPVCQAVQHAHQKGIIHRDLKPSNVLVALYDGKPVPKVIDFGVAKAAGQSLTDKTLVTGLGTIVGTVEYMSPEQAEINQLDIDTRSDIYSLGVLLYELLTGSPPFSRRELEQAGVLAMLRVIREQEPSKPSTKLSTAEGLPALAANRGTEPAELARLVCGELDWIVMKALEKDRNRRYETANGFALDLQRYLAGEPVLAAPASQWYRLRKFARRHRGPVVAAGLVLLTLIGGIAGTTAGLLTAERNAQQAREQRDAKDLALQAEQQARADETQARKQAFAALQSMTADVIEKKFAQGTVLTAEDRAFLRNIIAQYDAFAGIKGDDADSRALPAEGRWRVGMMRERLGDLAEAEKDFDQAIGIFQQLAAEFPSRCEFREQLAQVHNSRGVLLRDQGRVAETEHDFDQAQNIRRQLIAEFPSRPEFRQALAGSFLNRAIVLRDAGRMAESLINHNEAQRIVDQLVADFPSQPEFRGDQALNHLNRGNLLREMGRSQEAEQACNEAVKLYTQLTAEFPSQPKLRRLLALSYSNRGALMSKTGRSKEAEQDYIQALQLYKQLAANFPLQPEFRQELIRNLNNRGNLLEKSDRIAEANKDYSDALNTAQQLATDYPNLTETRYELARSFANHGHLLVKMGQIMEAEHDVDNAIRILKQLVRAHPKSLESRRELVRSLRIRVNLLEKNGRPSQVANDYHDAIQIGAQLAEDFPNSSEFRQGLAGDLNNRGVFLADSGKPKEAEQDYEQALKLKKQLVLEDPNRVDWQYEVTSTYKNLAVLRNAEGNWADAKRWLLAAGPHHLAALKAAPAEPTYRAGYRRFLQSWMEVNAWLLDRDEVVRAAETFRDLGWDAPGDAYDAACCVSLCIPIVARHDKLDDGQRKDAAQFYGDVAMNLLRGAVNKGYKDLAHLLQDSNLDPLRPRDDYRKLVTELDPSALAQARYYVHLGQWDQAAAEFAKLDFGTQPLDDNTFACACLFLIRGDLAGYDQFCQDLTRRLTVGKSPAPWEAYVLARSCAVGRKGPVDPAQAVQWANHDVASSQEPWDFHVLGLAQYRAGQYHQALQSFTRANVGNWTLRELNLFGLALVHHHLGHSDEALHCLEQGVEWLARWPEKWLTHDWLEAQLLRREAEDLLSPLEAGRFYVHLSQWEKAADKYAQADFRARPLPEDAFALACLFLIRGDREGYQRFCQSTIQQLTQGQAPVPFEAFVLARTCAVAGQSPVDPSQAVEWANQALASAQPAWYFHALGLAQYRAGQCEQALQSFAKADAEAWGNRDLNYFGLALAHHGLGHADEARKCLNNGIQWMKKEGSPSPGRLANIHPFDWVEAQVLRREAEELLKTTSSP